MTYREFISGKRIVFVGACPNIKGKGQGKHIDKFDVVVKTNGSIYFNSSEYFSDYGSRIDVLYMNNQFYREMQPRPDHLKKMGIKFIRMKTCTGPGLAAYNNNLPTEIIKDAMQIVNRSLKSALMGCYLIQDIINCNPSELHLTGIDFFASKKPVFEIDNYREYLPGYLPDKIRKQGNKINLGKTKDGHNQYENTKFIYKLLTESKIITMPDFIRDIMSDILNGAIA